MLLRHLSRFSIGLILWVGFVVRLAVFPVRQQILGLSRGGLDEIAFEQMAWQLSQSGRDSLSTYLFSGGSFLAYLGSLVYDITGRAPLLLPFLMVPLGAALVYVVYRAALELWEDVRVARLVALTCALFPQLVLNSTLFLRETPVSLCLAAASLYAVRFLKRDSFHQVIWFTLWIFLGTLFHSGVFFALPALLVGILLVRQKRSNRRLGPYAASAAAVLLLVGFIVWINATGFGLGKFGGSLNEALATFESKEALDPRGGAAFPEWLLVRGGIAESWKLPLRFLAFLFSPMVPFLVRSPRHLIGLLDAALYFLLFWVLLRNWREVWRNRPATVLLIVVLVLFFAYSLGVQNFGTAIRHRAKIVPLLLVVAAGLPILKRRVPVGRNT